MVAATAAAALAMGASVPLASANLAGPVSVDDLKDKQKHAERDVRQAEQDLEASSVRLRRAGERLSAARTELAGARTALATARGKLAVAAEKDQQMQAELAQAEADLATAESEVKAGLADVAAQKKIVADTILRIYAEGDPDLMAFSSLVEAESAEDLTRRAELNQAMVDRQTRAYDRLRAAQVLLDVHEKQVEDARDVVAVKREAAAENLAVKQELESEAEAAKASVVTLVGERAAARQQAAAARAADQRALAKANKEQDRIEEMLRRRAARLLAKRRAAARANAGGPTGGILSAPVPSAVTSSFGYRTHPIYGYWGLHDGTDFGVSCGQPIRAAAGGRVMSRYYSSVYGNRLVVDHGILAGAGVATIYNHASTYTVGVGQQVQRGEVIGYVGDTGWSTGCHLHFTVMENGRAVDPMKWL